MYKRQLDIKADQFVKALMEKGIPCYGIQWPEAYEERAYKQHNGFEMFIRDSHQAVKKSGNKVFSVIRLLSK